jgi:hypothetical protein
VPWGSTLLGCLSVAFPKAGVEIVSLNGRSTLRRCRPGSAKSPSGGYRCVRCPLGSFASASGSLHCRLCAVGTTSNAARTACGAAYSRDST